MKVNPSGLLDGRIVPRLLSDQFNETTPDRRGLAGMRAITGDDHDGLFRCLTDGDDQPALIGELIDKRGRDRWRGGGDDDAIVGSELWESDGAVTGEQGDIGEAQPGQGSLCVLAKLVNPFYRIDACSKGGENRALITGTCADFEDAMVRLEGKPLGHVGDNERLADGLSGGDGQRAVVVGMNASLERYKELAGDCAHGVENAEVGDAPEFNLIFHHAFAEVGPVDWRVLGHGADAGTKTRVSQESKARVIVRDSTLGSSYPKRFH